jgi:hypothetical protein
LIERLANNRVKVTGFSMNKFCGSQEKNNNKLVVAVWPASLHRLHVGL